MEKICSNNLLTGFYLLHLFHVLEGDQEQCNCVEHI